MGVGRGLLATKFPTIMWRTTTKKNWVDLHESLNKMIFDPKHARVP